MRSARRFVLFSTVFGAVLAALPALSHADAIELVSADPNGVTLRLAVPDVQVSAPGASGRSRLSAIGMDLAGEPGRPSLPQASTLVALPLGARASLRVVELGPPDTRDVRLVTGGRPGMRDDGGKLGQVPFMEAVAPIADGPWPKQIAELGEPFMLRRQRLVAVRLRPASYDEGAARLSIHRSLVVRVDFVGGTRRSGAAMPEPHWDAVLERAVSNFGQARGWREARTPSRVPALELLRRPAPGRLSARPPVGASAAAFDEDNSEVRVLVDTTGVWALTFNTLSQNGYPPNIAVDRVSVHRHEFVPGGTPAYVTLELPIEVDDANTDGVFNAGDRIVMWVQNWAERSRVSLAQRRWGDAEAVFVTHLSAGNGLRLPQRSGWLNQALTPQSSYRTRTHFEVSQVYMNTVQLAGFGPNESDTTTDPFLWTNIGFYDRSIDVFPFETSDLDNTRPVTVRVQWQGLRGNQHLNWADVRNGSNQFTSVVDSFAWQGRSTLTLENSLPGTALSPGRTNQLRLWGRTPNMSPPLDIIVNTGLNWFEIEYARSYKAMNRMLSCTSDSAAGDFEIRATSFPTRTIRVYDVTDSIAPVRLMVPDSVITGTTGAFVVRFQDAGAPGGLRRYVVFDFAKLIPASKVSPVTRKNLAGQPGAAYLIIAPEALLPAAERLAAHRRTQIPTVLVCPLEAVNDEFNGGRKSPYAIRRLLQHAEANWASSFVLLLGDGSEDPRNFTGTAGPDLVPAQVIPGPIGIFDVSFVNEIIVSDPWYVWCLTCPGHPVDTVNPKLHDMFIGREPVASLEQADAVVDKLITYDQVTADQLWRRKMLILADDTYSTLSFFGGGGGGTPLYCDKDYEYVFRQISDILRNVVLIEGGLAESEVEVFDLGEKLAGEPVYIEPSINDTCRVSWRDTQDHCHLSVTPDMFDRLNEGRVWWNYQGHANPFVISHEDLYRNTGFSDDQVLFNNTNRPTFFSAFSCHPNAFGTTTESNVQLGPSLGEDMVLLPQKGAIASWASSGYELLPQSAGNHLNVYLARALFVNPPRDTLFGRGGSRVVLGECVQLALLRNLAGGPPPSEDQVGISYNLLGDPATALSIGAPQAVVRANGLPVTSGTPVRLRTDGDTLRIDADLVSNMRLTSIVLERRIGSAVTVIPPANYQVTPAFPDSGAASQGGRRFHLVYRATLVPDSYVFTLRTTDRLGVTRAFDISLPFQTVLRADGVPVVDNDVVSPNAQLTITLQSPAPLTLPDDVQVTLQGNPVSYTFQPANGDTTGREWTLALTHGAFAPATYTLVVSAQGGASNTHTFIVDPSGGQVSIRNAYAFPNPFDEQRGTNFTFRLVSPSPTDVQIRVYTVTGRLVYRRTDRGVLPGDLQIAWNGLDDEGQQVSTGVYVYKLLATNGSSKDVYEGRLVKLRRPRRLSEEGTTP